MNNTNLITIFLTGLLTGGLTCMAVQGGLLTATLLASEKTDINSGVKNGKAIPILAFLGAKLAAYTILGFFLGWVGSFFQISLWLRVVMQILVVFFMLGTALSILEVHPIFRYFVITPPRFLTRWIRQQSKNQGMFASTFLGALTIFIPCGTTQAMMALSVASGKPVTGALVMAAFILGTSPIFFLLGYLATKLADTFQKNFMRAAAWAIILLAIFNLNNAVALTGSRLTLENLAKNIYCTVSWCKDNQPPTAITASDKLNLTIQSGGYNPDRLTVKSGSRVTLHIQNRGGTSCIQAFTIPSLGIQKVIPNNTEADITLDIPNQTGEIPFMCSMGMYRGVIQVI